MSNSLTYKTPRIVVDNNILFMAWYSLLGKCARVLEKAGDGELILYAPYSVKTELIRILKRANQSDKKIDFFLSTLPVAWVRKEVYGNFINKTKVKHNPDKPVEALSLALDCKILSADKHFDKIKNKIDIDELLKGVDNISDKLFGSLKNWKIDTQKLKDELRREEREAEKKKGRGEG